jgi:PAS domain S-box-containing protein
MTEDRYRLSEYSEANSSRVIETVSDSDRQEINSISLEALAQFFQLALDMLCLAGFDGYFKCLNPAWSKILGYTQAELLAKPYLEFVHPEDRAATIAEARKLETGGQTIEFQNRYRCKDGSYRWLSWNVTVVPEQQLFYCIARDITASKQKEEYLRHSQKQLADFIENAAIGLHWVGANGRILWANQSELNLLGYSRAEYVGHHIAEFHADQDAIADILQKLNNKETLNNYEAKLRCKDGSIKQVLINSNVSWHGDKFIHTRCFTINITERKQLEQQLHQSLEYLTNLKFALDQSAIVAITDPQGIIVEVNDQFCQISKYSPEELVGKDHRIINSGHHPPSFFKDMWSTIFRGKVWKGEIKNRAKDGSYYWVDTTIVSFLDDRGQPWQYLAIRFDITARKQAEEELRQEEERWQLALKGNKDGIWDWKIKTNEVFFSARWKSMLGYEEHEISNHLDEWSKRVHPDDLEAALQAVQDHFAQKTEYYINEHRVQCKDGSYKWILDRGKAIWDEKGNTVRMVGSHTDISDRKRAEAAEHQLKTALENAVEGISLLDPQGYYLQVNQAYATITGYQPEEMIGMNWQVTIHPEDLDRMQAAYQQMLRDGKVEVEAKGVRKDGSIFYKQVMMIISVKEEGQFEGHYCFMKDISERKRAEEELDAQMLRSQLFADISLKIRQSLQLDEILQTTVNEVQKLLDADRVLILHLKTPKTICVIQETVKPGWNSLIDRGIVDDCLDEEYLLKYPQGRLYSLPDVDLIQENQCLINFLRQFQVKSTLVVPVLLQEKLWGMLVIHQCSHPRNWSTEEIDILKEIANQIAIALGQSHLLKALAHFSTNLKHLHRINTTNYSNINDLFDDYLVTGCWMLKMSTGMIAKIEGESYKIQAVQSQFKFLEAGLEFNLKDTDCAAVIKEKRTITYTRVSEIELMKIHPVYQDLKLESYVGTPIFVNGQVYGTLSFYALEARGERFQVHELEIIELMAESIGKFIAADEIERQRQQAALALRESEARFRTMADSAPVLLWISDTDKQYTFFNQFWLKFTGRSLKQELGNGWTEGIYPHDLEHHLETYKTAFNRRETFQMEYRLRRADGQYRWVLDIGIPRITSDGDFLGYIGSCIDISDRKESEETLRKQASQQAVIAELGHYAISSSDLDSFMNQIMMVLACTLELECCKILELLPDKNELLLRAGVGWQPGLVGRATIGANLNSQAGYTLLSSEPIIVHDLRTETRFNDSPLLNQHKILSGVSVIIHAKDRPFGVLGVHSTQPRTFSRDDINFLQAVANMLSAAIEQKQSEIALQKSQQRWATLAQLAPVGIFITDRTGNYLYVNQCWCNFAGITFPEVSGRGWIDALHPEDRDRVLAEWNRATQNNLSFSSEYRLVRPDGKITWVYGQAIAETAVNGSVTGYIGTLTNLTERLKMEEMKRALEREQELSELKLRFFSMASHEFRTPLSIIMLAAQVLENSEPEWLDSKKLRNLKRIKDNTQKITQMLTDVLMLARAEARKLEFKPKTLNLQQFCQQILEEIETDKQENCAISFVNKGNRSDEIFLDEKLLHSILINLLSNAVKYSPQGEEINFEVKLEAQSVIFTIKDRGIGIPLQDQTHLFEAFHRGENVGNIDGTGLGLAIVKRCVDLQGGQITCDSYPGKGTTFIVSIPIISK